MNKIAYKGFCSDLICSGFQFEVGKEYFQSGDIVLCENGFHFCEDPQSIWQFHPPSRSRYALVEVSGQIIMGGDKGVASNIKIIRELSLAELLQEAARINRKRKVMGDFNNEPAAETCFDVSVSAKDYDAAFSNGPHGAVSSVGYCGFASATGLRSAASAMGNCAVASVDGYNSVASSTGTHGMALSTGSESISLSTNFLSSAVATGRNSVAAVFGPHSKAKGSLGNWIVLTEVKNSSIIGIKVFKVDGEKIKCDTYYGLVDNEPQEVNG